ILIFEKWIGWVGTSANCDDLLIPVRQIKGETPEGGSPFIRPRGFGTCRKPMVCFWQFGKGVHSGG
ncbi:MAG: hypothetical protein K9M84_08965, partial [Spirochaetia bacterium]|nr:hypothetical protein [Spirochaetia bacterium]